MKIAAKFLLVFCFCLNPCFAADSDPSKAEELYRSGEWSKASDAFKSIVEPLIQQNAAAPWLLFNYGTALFRAGSVPEAYSLLLKAHYLAPLDGDIRHNLKMVADKIPDQTKKILPSTWYSWWPDSIRPLPTEIWLSFFLLFTALFLWCAATGSKKIYSFLAASALFGFICFFAYSQNTVPVAVVLKDGRLRSGPDPKFQEITSVVGGALVNLEETRDSWVKIRYSTEEKETVGWLEAPTVLLVR